jgi:hypothetical protein
VGIGEWVVKESSLAVRTRTMSIGNRVAAALTAFSSNDTEQALHDICSAIDTTATKEAGKGGRRSYEEFIRDNFVLISRTAFGVEGTIGKLRIAYNHPDITPDADGLCGIEEVVYHVVRCGLYHEASLPATLTFVQTNFIKCDRGSTLVLPANLVKGLIAAVVVSPANSGETIDPKYELTFDFVKISVNKLWGKRAEVNALLDAICSVRHAISAIG